MTIDFLEIMNGVRLTAGEHETRGAELCAMELVAFLEGESHTDHPQCACPVLTEYVIGVNDGMWDSERSRLLPFLPRIVGTRMDRATEMRRAEYATWKALTVFCGPHMASMPPPGSLEEWDLLRDRALEIYETIYPSYSPGGYPVIVIPLTLAMVIEAAFCISRDANARGAASYASQSARFAIMKAKADRRLALLDAWLGILEGMLQIGQPSPGFSQPLPAPGEAARQLGMVKA